MGLGNVIYGMLPLRGKDVVDNLLSSVRDKPLSAYQGYVLDGKIGQLSNPNLLMNPDFKINQRGQTEYTEAWKYTVDRWMIHINNAVAKVTPSPNGGIVIVAEAQGEENYTSLVQTVDDYEKYKDKTLTFSIKIKNFSGSKVVTTVYDAAGTANIEIKGDGVYCVQHYMPFHAETLSVHIQCYGYTSAEIEWVKLEVGEIATPFVPPDPAIELLKCQRYFQIITNLIPIVVFADWYGLLFIYPLSVPMRIVPTVTIPNLTTESYVVGTQTPTVFLNGFSAGEYTAGRTPTEIQIHLTTEQQIEYNNGLYYKADVIPVICDAEIY